MAAVEVTISGVLYDKFNRTVQNVVLIDEASLTGLGVGGGFMPPGQGGGQSPIIWGADHHTFGVVVMNHFLHHPFIYLPMFRQAVTSTESATPSLRRLPKLKLKRRDNANA